MASSIVAAREMAARLERYENQSKRAKIDDKHLAEKLTAGFVGVVAAPALGYLDGRFDDKDGDTGDGYKLAGLPVVPIVGGIVAIGGGFLKGLTGVAVSSLGMATVTGALYSMGQRKGIEAAEKAKEG